VGGAAVGLIGYAGKLARGTWRITPGRTQGRESGQNEKRGAGGICVDKVGLPEPTRRGIIEDADASADRGLVILEGIKSKPEAGLEVRGIDVVRKDVFDRRKHR